MAGETGLRAVTALACAWILSGCGTLFLSPRPEDAYERSQSRRVLAEAEAMERHHRGDEEDDTSTLLREADRFARSGDLDRAVAGYVDVIQSDPSNPVPQARIANLQMVRDPERAAGLFRRLVQREPEMAIAHAGLGLALLALNRLEPAEESLRHALGLDPDLANAHYGLSVVCDLDGRHEEAQKHAHRARELRPRDATVANNLGVSYLLSGDNEQAESALRDAVLLNPDDPAIRNNLAMALARQERFDEALAQFLRAGSEQAAHNNLGYLLMLANRFEQAIPHFERALEIGGDHTLVVLRNLNAALDARESAVPAAPATDAR